LSYRESCGKTTDKLCMREVMKAVLEVVQNDAVKAEKHRKVLACVLFPLFASFFSPLIIPCPHACIHSSYQESCSKTIDKICL
jgi:hypothetical protein